MIDTIRAIYEDPGDDLTSGEITAGCEPYLYGDAVDTEEMEMFTVEPNFDADGVEYLELMRVEVYSLDSHDEQEYAKELRRCCGDDVAAEELS